MTSPSTPDQIAAARSLVYTTLMEAGEDFQQSFRALSEVLYHWNKLQGFWPEDPTKRNVGEILALIHSELSEGLEAHRHSAPDDKLPHRSGLEVELADAIIRIMDMAAGLQLDVAPALLEKIEYNLQRPFRHSKAY